MLTTTSKSGTNLSRGGGGGGGGGSGGVLNKVLYGEALPRGPNTYPFIYFFDRKGNPSIENGTHFTYLQSQRKDKKAFWLIIDDFY